MAVSDDELIREIVDFGAKTGILVCPEGAAALAATKQLVRTGWIRPQDRVVIFNTGSGLKYAEAIALANQQREVDSRHDAPAS